MSNDVNDVAPIDLDGLQDAILAAITTAFTTSGVCLFKTVADYERMAGKIECPALFLDVVQVEPSDDDGTGQLNAFIRYDAYIIYKMDSANYKRECRKTALAVAGLVNANRWGQPVSPGKLLGCYKDTFEPQLDSYEVWRVEWHQEAYQGVSIWAVSTPPVTQVLLALSPAISIASEYADITAGESI